MIYYRLKFIDETKDDQELFAVYELDENDDDSFHGDNLYRYNRVVTHTPVDRHRQEQGQIVRVWDCHEGKLVFDQRVNLDSKPFKTFLTDGGRTLQFVSPTNGQVQTWDVAGQKRVATIQLERYEHENRLHICGITERQAAGFYSQQTRQQNAALHLGYLVRETDLQ